MLEENGSALWESICIGALFISWKRKRKLSGRIYFAFFLSLSLFLLRCPVFSTVKQYTSLFCVAHKPVFTRRDRKRSGVNKEVLLIH